MPFNGSGTFSIINSFVPGTTILSSAVPASRYGDSATCENCSPRTSDRGLCALWRHPNLG
jgi:hypothetical protein